MWESGKQTDAIGAAMTAYQQTGAKDYRLALQSTYYLFLLGDYANCIHVLEQQLKATPENLDVLNNLAACYSRNKNWDKAIEFAKKVISIVPDNFNAWDILASAYSKTHEYELASQAGTQVLTLKDRTHGKINSTDWKIPTTHPKLITSTPHKKKVIAFSLWGENPRYLRGGLCNLLLAPELYPEWILRFYVDQSVPQEFIELITQHGAEVVFHSASETTRQKLCRRFLVANDPQVGYFMVRDVDSVFSTREVLSVNEWLASDKYFHVMRDWWTHTDLMLAGMWGGVANALPNLSDLLNNYTSEHLDTPNIDQWFLRDVVWKYVKQSCLVHDRCFTSVGSEPHPGETPQGMKHIGQDEYSVKCSLQENFLKPWIAKYPCLGKLS